MTSGHLDAIGGGGVNAQQCCSTQDSVLDLVSRPYFNGLGLVMDSWASWLALFSILNVSLRMGNGNAATDQTQPILEIYEFPNKRYRKPKKESTRTKKTEYNACTTKGYPKKHAEKP